MSFNTPTDDIVLKWQRCGEDFSTTGQVSTVFNCYVPIDAWVSYFYISQLCLSAVLAISLFIKLKWFTPNQQEEIRKIILKKI